MPTDIIDITLHTTSFPATYAGKGTLIGNPYTCSGVPESVNGYFTSDGNPVQIALGFQPTYVKIVNVTDGIVWEWNYGMPAANSIKNVLGGSPTSAMDTTSQLAISGPDVKSGAGGNQTLTIGATAAGSAKLICYSIRG